MDSLSKQTVIEKEEKEMMKTLSLSLSLSLSEKDWAKIL
jgi:hypothetical protein